MLTVTHGTLPRPPGLLGGTARPARDVGPAARGLHPEYGRHQLLSLTRVAAERVIGGHLDQDDPDAVRVLDPHLGQSPGLGDGLAHDPNPRRAQPLVLGAHIPYLEPDHHRPRPGAGAAS